MELHRRSSINSTRQVVKYTWARVVKCGDSSRCAWL